MQERTEPDRLLQRRLISSETLDREAFKHYNINLDKTVRLRERRKLAKIWPTIKIYQ